MLEFEQQNRSFQGKTKLRGVKGRIWDFFQAKKKRKLPVKLGKNQLECSSWAYMIAQGTIHRIITQRKFSHTQPRYNVGWQGKNITSSLKLSFSVVMDLSFKFLT